MKAFTPVTLSLAAGQVRAHLLDLSETGALVHSATPVQLDVRIRLQLGTRTLAAVVVWVDGKKFGVRFAVPLLSSEVQAIVAKEPD